jgi:mannose-6-phosphate isomerase
MANPIRDYDWGSTTHLARMQGRTPTGRPEAELWMGSHSTGPSALIGLDGTLQPLDRLLDRHPQTLLGSDVLSRHGARLPYLLKVLAIAKPLSLQVHPGPQRAQQLFTEGSGPYLDPYPKPEMLYALRPMDTMCGFRDSAAALALLQRLDCPRLSPVVDALTASAPLRKRLEDAFAVLVTWPRADRAALVADVAERSRQLLRAAPDGGPLDPSLRRALIWVARLAALHQEDPLVAAPFLLDVVQLSPGETLFIPAGTPHTYLAGLGVEIMGNSDNVLRAGLTQKEIAVEELLEVVDGGAKPVRDVPEVPLGPYEVAWRPPVEEFQLSRLRLTGSTPIACYPRLCGPQVVLCTAGTVGVATPSYALALRPSESAFVGASGGPITLAGPGEVFRAAVGEPLS